MKKVGLIAGAGNLPIEFCRSAKRSGEKVIVFALRGMALPQLEEEADRVYWLNIGQYNKFAFLLLKERVHHLALLGKVDKKLVYQEKIYDPEAKDALKGLDNKKDYSVLEEVTKRLKWVGIEVIDSMKYLSHLIPGKGVLSRAIPDSRVVQDIDFGYNIARRMAGMDIGQVVVVKDKNIVAVEAMEGTDATIERAGKVAGPGCVMIKVSRPHQDPRWDIPTVGLDTMIRLVESGFSALAVESDRTFLIDKDKLVELADSSGIVVKAI